jgi:hypothetical protein
MSALEWLVHRRGLLLKLRPQLRGVFYVTTLKRYLHLIVERFLNVLYMDSGRLSS